MARLFLHRSLFKVMYRSNKDVTQAIKTSIGEVSSKSITGYPTG